MFFLFLAIVSTVSAAGNTCKTGNVVNRLVNSQPYYWPTTWNENQTTPSLAKDQTCSWIVTVPKGYYAKLSISGKTTDKDSRFQMIDSAGNLMQTTSEEMQPYYFPPAKFTLAVSNKAVATFAFKIQWFLLPTEITSYNSVGPQVTLINATNSLYYRTYYAPQGVSLLAFPVSTTSYYSLRSTLVYQGSSLDGTYISNLYSLYQTNNQWISKDDTIVLVNLETSKNADLLLIQEALRIKDITFTELIPTVNSKVSVTVNSTKKKTALVAAYQVKQTLTDVQMDTAAYVTIYYGSLDPYNFYKNFTKTQFQEVLPVNFDNSGGNVYEFYVYNGKATFTFQF
ncbi:hypothetical protein CRE_09276 [Caenorhabditis remanei]|uniref:CUB-like domain-containing protein n=1 Tax=Caenorhabditis remanei TaxID=31234 RepID=E3LHW7_CAERE|nr:hypothetical protein CRE_09276 [Caenorhabditis remanei]